MKKILVRIAMMVMFSLLLLYSISGSELNLIYSGEIEYAAIPPVKLPPVPPKD